MRISGGGEMVMPITLAMQVHPIQRSGENVRLQCLDHSVQTPRLQCRDHSVDTPRSAKQSHVSQLQTCACMYYISNAMLEYSRVPAPSTASYPSIDPTA